MIHQLEWQKQINRLLWTKNQLTQMEMPKVKTKELVPSQFFLQKSVQIVCNCLERDIGLLTNRLPLSSFNQKDPLTTLISSLMDVKNAALGLGWSLEMDDHKNTLFVKRINKDYPLVCQMLILYISKQSRIELFSVKYNIDSLQETNQQLEKIKQEINQADQLLNSYEKINQKMNLRKKEFLQMKHSDSIHLIEELMEGISECIDRTTIQKKQLIAYKDNLSEIVDTFHQLWLILSEWEELVVRCLRDIQENRPISPNESTIIQVEWEQFVFLEQYQLSESFFADQLWDQRQQLMGDGWDEAAIDAYFRKVSCFKWNVKEIMSQWRQTQQVGSELYTEMYQRSQKTASEKIELVFQQLGAVMEEGILQLTGKLFLDPQLSPHSLFLEEWAHTVQQANKNCLLSDPRVHQFRMYIDRQNIQYIRTNFRLKNMTDEEALKAYVFSPTPQGMGAKKMRAERARLHNKYLKTSTYLHGQENRKRLTPNFHSEFILDSGGCFVSQWNVLDQDDAGRLIMDPLHYAKKYPTAEKYLYFENQIMNGESFNYANANNEQHRYLDILPVAHFDPPLRKQIGKRWRNPENNKQYQWRKVDRKKDGYSKRHL